jgi:hypothetical protein
MRALSTLFGTFILVILALTVPASSCAQVAQKSDSSSKEPRPVVSEQSAQGKSSADARSKLTETDKVWKSQELDMLAVGLAIGDVDGDGQNEVAVIDPHSVHVYRVSDGKLSQLAEYSAGSLELKGIDATTFRDKGPARLYVTAQNRGALASFVLEYRKGALVPVIRDFDYFFRVINYPTQGPILLGQKKGARKMFDGPVYRLTDKGDEIVVAGRFGTPLKIPVLGFTIGDFEGNRQPLIAVYDRNDHLRIYRPDGTRLYVSKGFYGGSDILLRWVGPERQVGADQHRTDDDKEEVYFRPRIGSLSLEGKTNQEIVAISHSSKTRRLLSRTKMLEEGQVLGLVWNGDALEEQWGTPKLEGTITDFAVDKLPGLSGTRLITLERKKTDWLAFLRSKSQVRAYDLPSLIREGLDAGRRNPAD